MSCNYKTRLGVAVATLASVTALGWLARSCGSTPTRAVAASAPKEGEEEQADNGMCYVCHLTLENEKITRVHFKEGHGCTKCHGPSTDHMHDEMLMTTPDHLYGRRDVAKMCGECHKHPHEDKQRKVEEFLDKWRGKERPNGRAITDNSICTDCHGTHNIDKGLKKEDDDERPAEFAALFNGKDLSGWRADGDAQWKIKLGRITGTPKTGSGDLWSEAQYEDYLLAVTFRAEWPIHAGVWLRGTDADRGPRVEIFQSRRPLAHTGSVGLPGKGLALASLRDDLFDAGGWNTLSMEVRGNRVAVWLNGEEIGAVRCAIPAKGRIGLHLKGGPGFENAELAVREVQIQQLRGDR